MARRRTKDSERQARFHERLHTPPVGIRAPHPGSCYGSCCGHYVRGGELCTVCRKLYSPTRRTHKYLSGTRTHCCGYHTVTVSPRIRVPRAGAEARWRQFLKHFPEFKQRDELKCDGTCAEMRPPEEPEIEIAPGVVAAS